MFGRKSPQVLVVGAGPVGLFSALSLSQRGVDVQIVDTGLWPCTRSYALALHATSLALLRTAGLYERVMAGAVAVPRVGLYDLKRRRAEIALDDGPVAVVRQDVLERLLEKALEERGIGVAWRQEVAGLTAEPGSVLAVIDKYEKQSRGYVVAGSEWAVSKSSKMEVPFVVGADGYASRVRDALGIPFPEVGPPAYYAVFELKPEAPVPEEMRVVLGDATTDVMWPLPGGGVRWSFQLPDYQPSDEIPAGGFPTVRLKDRRLAGSGDMSPGLEEASYSNLIAQRAPWFPSGAAEFEWRSVVRFERRLVPRFGSGRMWLAGDAAHLASPVGVQSMNAGFSEADCLAGLLVAVLRDEAPLSVLDSYDARWSATWRRLQGIEATPAKPSADPWVAANASRLISCLPVHDQALATPA